jgi:hypothetical protein
MSETKKIATFSWLIRRAEAMLRKDPEEYARLRGTHSVKLLPGCRVQMTLQDHHSETQFILQAPDGYSYATVRGMQYQGVFYTKYKFEITPTKYRKRLHKYLPITLPEGAKSQANTPCIYHHADGSVAHNGAWIGNRPRYVGKPDLGTVLVFKDEDGRLVKEQPTGASELFLGAAAMNDTTTPMDLIHGFLPGSCHSKIAWYESMECPEVEHYQSTYRTKKQDGTRTLGVEFERVDKVPGPLWDTKKMKLLAARAHSSALAFVKKFPHMKIAMYPMARMEAEGNKGTIFDYGPLYLDRFNGEVRRSVVVGRDIEDNPICYYLPQLVVWWHEGVGHKYPHSYHEECKHFRGLRYVKIIVPPAGCASLHRGPGRFSVRSQSFRAGPKDYGWMFQDKIGRGMAVQERACHGLFCFDQRSLDKHLNQWRLYNCIEGVSHVDSLFHDWDTDQNVVVVEEQIEGPGTWSDHQSVDYYACSPGQVFSHMEEKELLDSLPMC